MPAAEDISLFALGALKPILDQSGFVIYSDAKSLQTCPIYLLGHNPGGSPEDQADATVRASLVALPDKVTNNYLDEQWTTARGRSWPTGQAPLQRRVAWLLEQLGFDPRQVPCSNLIFVRSIDVTGSSFDELSDLCWQVHERILQVVKPKLLLVFGNSQPSPYSYLKNKFVPASEQTIASGHGSWLCRSFQVRSDLTVIGIPHLSRYNIIHKRAVVDWIQTEAAPLGGPT